MPGFTAEGRHRVAELVRASMGWQGLSGPAIESTGRVSRATVDRIKRADPNVSDTMLRALGDVLDLPRDFLIYVGSGDVEAIRAAASADPDLVRWTLSSLFADDPDVRHSVRADDDVAGAQRRRSRPA